MKKIYMMLIVVLLMFIAGCSKSSDPVPIPLSSAKAITAFSLNGTAAMIHGESNMISVPDGVVGTINETAKTITVTMPYGTDVTNLVATFTTTGAGVKVSSTVQKSGTTRNNFANPVIYTVTAANATTQNYTVTVTVAPSQAKEITAFSLNGVTGTIDETAKTIAVTMPYGTDVTALVATFSTTGVSVKVGSTVQISGTTPNDFTSPVIYTVTAADATTQDYTVTVTVAPSQAKEITAFSIAGVTGTIDEAAKTIAVTMPYGTDVTALVATFSTTGVSVKVGSTVQISGTTANNFTSPVTYTVTAADATTQDYTVTVTVEPADYNSSNIGILKYVPAGSFQRDGTPTNISTVTTAFRISQHEITRAQFLAVMETDPSNPNYSTGTSDPVQQVNWYHAIAFCNKLSLLEGFTLVYFVAGVDFSTLTFAQIPTIDDADWNAATANWSANGYRLPTEMEWMWAAMGATSGYEYTSPTYLTGYAKAFAGSTGSNAIGDYAWTWENSSTGTKEVGTRLPNELGLYDMSGNVWECVWDWYDGYPAGPLTDYRGAVSGTRRVIRGGGWSTVASDATVANRGYDFPRFQNIYQGFRVVRP